MVQTRSSQTGQYTSGPSLRGPGKKKKPPKGGTRMAKRSGGGGGGKSSTLICTRKAVKGKGKIVVR